MSIQSFRDNAASAATRANEAREEVELGVTVVVRELQNTNWATLPDTYAAQTCLKGLLKEIEALQQALKDAVVAEDAAYR